jgi:iron(II)-dependent oxidoreductase
MPEKDQKHPAQNSSERARRRRYLSATLITCTVLLMVGGVMHVIKIGATRLDDMRNLASYDPKDMGSHIRAAGEDITRHREHEYGINQAKGYTPEEAAALLKADQWAELETEITIPAGSFVMGTDSPMANEQDRPQHKVTLPAYKIDKYPVTNAQYARFVAATGHRAPSGWPGGRIPKGQALRPVTLVSWSDAAAYAKWAGKRLPTEAEFEKAGRGTDGRRWPWGNQMDPERLNTNNNRERVTDVTEYANGASPYGVMGMAGNVEEWTADDFAPYPGSDAPPELFQVKEGASASAPGGRAPLKHFKVIRGGSWKGDPFSTSLYHRNSQLPEKASDFYGFRCAADIKGKEK